MASNFPHKVLASTNKQTASEDAAYAELDKILNDNPLAEVETVTDGGYLPDFSKAIRLERAIYRINVPGYIYHHVKDPAVSGSTSSGVLVSCYPAFIDTAIGLTQRCHKCVSSGGSGKPEANGVENYTSAKYFCPKSKASIKVLNPAGSVLGEASNLRLLIANQRYGFASKNPERAVYAVNTGAGSAGGIGCSMIPIVPGIGASKTFAGMSGLLETISARLSYSTTPTGKKSSGSYTTDDGSKHSYSGATVVTLSENKESTIFEGRGTYIYHFHNKASVCDAGGTDASDEYLFIPCAGVANGVKPITKIRDCFAIFNTTIANSSEIDEDIALWHFCKDAFDNHGDSMWVLLKRAAEGGSDAAAAGNRTLPGGTMAHTTVNGFRYKNWKTGKFKFSGGEARPSILMSAFANQSLRPRSGKFFVRFMYKQPGLTWNARQVYPSGSKVPSGSIGAWTWDAAYLNYLDQYFRGLTLFDPTVDGETGGQRMVSKYDVQKDLAYD